MKWPGLLALILALWLTGIASWIAAGPAEDPEGQADIAIVLGAAVDGREPSPVFAARLDHAIGLYRTGRVGGLLLTGARSPEDELSEAVAGRLYAMKGGVPADAILIEEQSRTTFQNLVNARGIMRGEGISTALVVSDPLHLRRALAMAHALEIDAAASAASGSRYRSWNTRLPFLLRETYFLHHFWLFGA